MFNNCFDRVILPVADESISACSEKKSFPMESPTQQNITSTNINMPTESYSPSQWLRIDSEDTNSPTLRENHFSDVPLETCIHSSRGIKVSMHVDENFHASIHSEDISRDSNSPFILPSFSPSFINPLTEAECNLWEDDISLITSSASFAGPKGHESYGRSLEEPDSMPPFSEHWRLPFQKQDDVDSSNSCGSTPSQESSLQFYHNTNEVPYCSWQDGPNSQMTTVVAPAFIHTPPLRECDGANDSTEWPTSWSSEDDSEQGTDEHTNGRVTGSDKSKGNEFFDILSSDIKTDFEEPLDLTASSTDSITSRSKPLLASTSQLRKILNREIVRRRHESETHLKRTASELQKYSDSPDNEVAERVTLQPIRRNIFSNCSIRGHPSVYSALQTIEDFPRPLKKGLKCGRSCGKRFSSWEKFAQHIDDVHGLFHRPVECPVSDCVWSVLGFATNSECGRHIRGAHMPPKFTCELCAITGWTRVFSRSDALRRHVKTMHCNENLKTELRKPAEKKRKQDSSTR